MLFKKKPKVDHKAIKQRISFVLGSLADHYKTMCPGNFEQLDLSFHYESRDYLVTIRPVREGK